MPPQRRTRPSVCVPSCCFILLSDGTGPWQADSWRSPTEPSDQQSFAVLCLAAAAAAGVDADGLFQSGIPTSPCQTKQTPPQRSTKKPRGETRITSGQLILCLSVEPCENIRQVVFVVYFHLHMTLICPFWKRNYLGRVMRLTGLCAMAIYVTLGNIYCCIFLLLSHCLGMRSTMIYRAFFCVQIMPQTTIDSNTTNLSFFTTYTVIMSNRVWKSLWVRATKVQPIA